MQRPLKDSMRRLTLCHDFRVIEIPAQLYELTGDLLRKLFDQAVHYGFVDAPMSAHKILHLPFGENQIKVTASLDADFLMLSVGSSRNKPFYLYSPKSLIYWESALSVNKVAGASAEIDETMRNRGYFDPASGARTDLLTQGKFAVSEVFVRPYLFYIIPDDFVTDPRQIFDEPEKLTLQTLYGKQLLCLSEDAEAVRFCYKPLSNSDIEDATNLHAGGMRRQMNPRRYS